MSATKSPSAVLQTIPVHIHTSQCVFG
uniref:Uncharacterized protein n=1 Tax=Arundo donax TaxID=35708 RepID=A0A0A9BX00_ARUDO